MSSKYNFLGLLPVRSGSKGISNKNIKKFNEKPLMQWACEAMVNSKLLDYLICSTDSDEYANVATNCGLNVPFKRPNNLSNDNTLIIDVVKYILHELELLGQSFSHVVIIQATSPSVTAEYIDKGIEMMKTNDFDSLITGYIDDSFNPSLLFTLNKDNQVNWYDKSHNKRSLRRQDFDKIFIRTGILYIHKVDNLLKFNSLYGKNIGCLEIPKKHALTIDDEIDFTIAEKLMEIEKE
mgnify:CR=1 FL=1